MSLGVWGRSVASDKEKGSTSNYSTLRNSEGLRLQATSTQKSTPLSLDPVLGMVGYLSMWREDHSGICSLLRLVRSRDQIQVVWALKTHLCSHPPHTHTSFLIFKNFMYGGVLTACKSVPHLHEVPLQVRRGRQNPWN